ncbi:MAG TPA: DUF58 domain-containing protein [Microthrixaceae bacterium]|jgi:uncharacterized protein (DUF58 family)|nr:DUF58 domain-containing protein [Microthrixaceae bacterium]HQF95550.1 DUF58 domain-containing protein [Microthrixaceae bacterium]
MPTRRGFGLVAVAATLTVLAAFGGLPSVAVLGVGGLALVAVSGLATLSPVRLDVRSIDVPASRVEVGTRGQITIVLTNPSARRAPALTLFLIALDDRITVAVPRLAPGADVTVTLPLPTKRRGSGSIGPLVTDSADPFGLFRRRLEFGRPQEFIVHPRHHRLEVIAPSSIRNSEGPAGPYRRPDAASFVGLRVYRPGDDRRQIHWPTVARTGELMVREHADATLERLVLAFDTRSARWDEVRFEQAVEVVASVAVAVTGSGVPLTLVIGPDRHDVGGRDAAAGVVLDLLAGVAIGPAAPKGPTALDTLLTLTSATTSVLVTGAADAGDHVALAELATRLPVVVIAEIASALAPRSAPASTRVRSVRAATSSEFARLWDVLR